MGARGRAQVLDDLLLEHEKRTASASCRFLDALC
jgi:hypothetical protein